MTDVVIGIVSEGPTDQLVLQYCIGPALQNLGYNPTFRQIQPTLDRTSGSYSDGGWRKVYQWCMANGPNERSRFFGVGLFAHSEAPPLDALLVHVDGDIFNILSENDIWETVDAPNPTVVTKGVAEIHDYCVATIKCWMDISPNEASIPSPTVMACEAWMLAANAGHTDAETLHQPKKDFAIYWLNKHNKNVPDGIQVLHRRHKALEREVQECTPDIENLGATMLSFRSSVEAIAQQIAKPTN